MVTRAVFCCFGTLNLHLNFFLFVRWDKVALVWLRFYFCVNVLFWQGHLNFMPQHATSAENDTGDTGYLAAEALDSPSTAFPRCRLP